MRSPLMKIAELRQCRFKNNGNTPVLIVIKGANYDVLSTVVYPKSYFDFDFGDLWPEDLVTLEIPDDADISVVKVEIKETEIWRSTKP